MIVSIGMGGVDISIYSENRLQINEYIKIGSLRLREILADLERLTLDFPMVIEGFVESKIYLLDSLHHQIGIQNVIGLGGELGLLLEICRTHKFTQEENFLDRNALEKIYNILHVMTTEQIISSYHIHRNEAEIIVPSAIIFRRFLRSTQARGIYVPKVSLRHGLLANMVDEQFDTERKEDFNHDIVSLVWYLGRKFMIDENHARQVEKLSLGIFEQTGRIHKLGERDKLYLQLAAILHDTGKFINTNEHDRLASDVICCQEIIGLSDQELNLVANIARYHSEENPQLWHENYQALSSQDQLVVSKLAAILKLADALDISHQMLIESLIVTIDNYNICFNIQARGDILLETWNFSNQAAFFEEVYGYKPLLKRKR
jgi:exopolyphosphatase/guanosine-5'-triphosphate,3'-diphosphate pyrophosphatase